MVVPVEVVSQAGDPLAIEENVLFLVVAPEVRLSQSVATGPAPVERARRAAGRAGCGRTCGGAFFYALSVTVVDVAGLRITWQCVRPNESTLSVIDVRLNRC